MHNEMGNNCPNHIGSMCTKGYVVLSSMKLSLDECWYAELLCSRSSCEFQHVMHACLACDNPVARAASCATTASDL
jgi:hypothetical protein